MSDLQIKISTPAELAGARAVEQQLERDIGKAKALGEQYDHLEKKLKSVRDVMQTFKPDSGPGAFDALATGIDVTRKKAGEAEVSLGSFKKELVAAGLALATLGLKGAVDEFASFEQNVTTLDAALARNGQLTSQYREQLQQLAGELETTTNVADEQWLAVLTRLVQFGSTPESIGMDVDAVKNLAGIVGDVSTAAQLYSRALQGNFDMFGRYGIKVDEAATQTDKLAKLQQKLAEIGGGQLEARTNSLNGTFGKLNVQWGNTLQGMGAVIDKTMVLRGVLGLVTDALDYWNDFLPETVDKVSGLTNAAEGAAEAFSDLENTDPFKKTKDSATAAKTEVDKLVASMEAAHRRTLAEQDAQLKEELAGLDLQEAATPTTPQSSARFNTARRQAQLRAEVRRANRDFFEAGDEARTIQGRMAGMNPEERAAAEERLRDLASRRDTALSAVRAGNVGQMANLRGAQRDEGERVAKEEQQRVEKTRQAADKALRELGASTVASNNAIVDMLRQVVADNNTLRNEVRQLKSQQRRGVE